MTKTCKEIPTIDILDFLSVRDNSCHRYKSHDESAIRNAMPNGFELPDKLVVAKMDKLIRKGLVSGCSCGCRGDFKITEKGMKYLEENGQGSCPECKLGEIELLWSGIKCNKCGYWDCY